MKDISKIISTVFLIFSIFLLIYILYRSEVYHSGTKLDYYLKYYIISGVIIIFSIASFFIQKNIKINITLFVVSTTFVLYLIEGYLDFSQFLFEKQYFEKRGIERFESRTRFEMYQDLKKEDPNIVVKISPSAFINEINQNIYPLSGISNKKTLYCNENGYYTIYQSDRYGFNNPNEEWDKKEIKYLLVGDSFTHGACVNEPDTISGNLRSALNQNKEGVLSLGYSGNGPLIEYATLREYFPLTNAKRVLWMYYENDLTDLDSELNNSILLNYLNDKKFTQNLKSRQKEVDKKLFNMFLGEQERLRESMLMYKKLWKESFTFEKFIRLYRIWSIKNNNYILQQPTPLFTEFERIIKLSKDFSENNGAKFYFIYLPGNKRYSNFLKNYSHDYINHDKVIEIVKNLNIPIIDFHAEFFAKHKDPLSLFAKFTLTPFKKYGHYNKLGYKLTTRHIFNKIKGYESIN